jgi:hypothetical protein
MLWPAERIRPVDNVRLYSTGGQEMGRRYAEEEIVKILKEAE